MSWMFTDPQIHHPQKLLLNLQIEQVNLEILKPQDSTSYYSICRGCENFQVVATLLQSYKVVTRLWHFVQGIHDHVELLQPCMMAVKWLFKW